MEPAHFGEREATTDRGVSVAGSPRAGRVPDIEMLDSRAETSTHGAPLSIEAAVALGRAPWSAT